MRRFSIFGVCLVLLGTFFASLGESVLAQGGAGPSSSYPDPMMGPGMDPMMGPGMGPGMAQQPTTKPADPATAALQALLYDDCYFVARFDLQKIDYQMLDSFFGDLIENGVGTTESSDEYVSQLQEYQKSQLKQGVSQLLQVGRNSLEQNYKSKGIGEVFFLVYEEPLGDESVLCWAFPSAHLTDAQKDELITYLADSFKPLCIFERFGFLVMADHANSQASYKKDADALKEARKNVLPKIRARFAQASDAETAARRFDALVQTNGTVASVIALNASVFQNIDKLAGDSETVDFQIQDEIKQFDFAKVNWGSLSFSLVGSPKLVLICQLTDEATATQTADELKKQTEGLPATVAFLLKSQLAQLENIDSDKIDVDSFMNKLFESIQPQVKGNEIAVVFDLAVVKDNASVFIPFFNGTSDNAIMTEADEIDWGEDNKLSTPDANAAADESAAPDSASPTTDEATPTDETTKPAETSDEEIDFGDESTDENPFGNE